MKSSDIDVALDARAELAEGPFWDDELQVLHWVDIFRGTLHTFDPATGVDRHREVGCALGAARCALGGGFVLALQDGFGRLDDSGAVEVVVPVETDRPANRLNDGACDRGGRFWAGSVAEDHAERAGALYCLEPDLSVRRVVGEVSLSNGLDWSPDGETLYFIDSLSYGVDAFPFDVGRGALGPRRRLVDFPKSFGLADGMTVDADGCLWIAFWQGRHLRRYTTNGSLDREIEFPVTNVTSCAFGGPRLDRLYVTTGWRGLTDAQRSSEPHAGAIFCLDPGVTGIAPFHFGG